MTHEIKTTNDKYIDDIRIRDGIIRSVELDCTFTYFDKTKINIVSHKVDMNGDKVTIVEVE